MTPEQQQTIARALVRMEEAKQWLIEAAEYQDAANVRDVAASIAAKHGVTRDDAPSQHRITIEFHPDMRIKGYSFEGITIGMPEVRPWSIEMLGSLMQEPKTEAK